MRRYDIYGRKSQAVKVSDYLYETERAALEAVNEDELEELLRRANAVMATKAKKHPGNKPAKSEKV
jgi:hypothetical protein